MSAVTRALSRRGTLTTMENMDREEFDKVLSAAITKAINIQETAVKEKHLRTLILGTYKEKGAGTFWNHILRLQVEGSPILSWKFCHALHKMMRDGHRNAISDSLKYRSKIHDLGKLWSHIKDGYGPLIYHYCKLLLMKLEFHYRNVRIPGNLQMTDEELEALGEKDVNNWFQLTVEMLDYMDEILGLQKQVFNSLDMSRASSMTASGQCRLAPLIVCILDSSALYDYLVKMLFKLYAALPPDVLTGHRDRFNAQFKLLKQFYYSSSNLQYFKYLVSIPSLPEQPPNFVIASDFENYVTPEVRIHDPSMESGLETPPDSRSVVNLPLVDVNDTHKADKAAYEKLANELNEREQIINTLRHDLDDAKATLHHSHVQSSLLMQQMQEKLEESAKDSFQHKELIEQLTEENERYRTQAEQLQNEKNQQTAAKFSESEKKTQNVEEKLKKLKELYGKLREEHIDTLKKLATVQKDFDCARKSAEDFAAEKNAVMDNIVEVQNQNEKLHNEIQVENLRCEELRLDFEKLTEELQATRISLESLRQNQTNENEMHQKNVTELQYKFDDVALKYDSCTKRNISIFGSICSECVSIINDTFDHFDNPAHLTTTCSPEFVLALSPSLIESLDRVQEALNTFAFSDDLFLESMSNITGPIVAFLSNLTDLLLHGKSTANLAPSNQVEKLETVCRRVGSHSKDLFHILPVKDRQDDAKKCCQELKSAVEELLLEFRSLLGKMGDINSEELGELYEKEMKTMDAAVKEAAAKMQEIMSKSKLEDTGVRLEVNSKIIDACTSLMVAVIELIQKSRDLQTEIVQDGGGSGSVKEFYKRHHQWTEGLLSAAKAVGVGARVLVDSADRVISGQGKFEELMVASQEVAASTAQLVVSSKVKADKNSQRLLALSAASRRVTSATASVLGTVKSGREIFEEKASLDFSNLSLHQAKRLEMEVQVKVLELESSLEKERRRLTEIRKVHYQLADPSEGWEEQGQK